ncbi:unnamed protein product, partial [Rotaria magnacalcarata]
MQKSLTMNHPSLVIAYNNIGLVYYSMGEYSKALSYLEMTLEIQQQFLTPVHLSIATTYSNIGV